MKNFWGGFLGSITGAIIAGIVGAIVFAIITVGMLNQLFESDKAETTSKAKDKILKVDLNYPIKDFPSKDPFDGFSFSFDELDNVHLKGVVESILFAAKDKNIKALFLDVDYSPNSLATLATIRNALLKFKESGKPVYCYSNSLSQSTYFLATVADSIFLHPMGGIDWKGIGVELKFFKNTLNMLGVKPVIFRPTGNKFKSAVEPLIRENMSEPNRLQYRELITDYWQFIVDKVSKSRNIPENTLNDLATRYLSENPDSALKYNMVDGLVYIDEFYPILWNVLNKKDDDDVLGDHFIGLSDYYKKNNEKFSKSAENKIAIIYAEGGISMGGTNGDGITHLKLTKALRQARNDEDVKAIVLRVNSPGGSALASDIIWREVKLAADAKPLVVSMGTYAASGGYYISAPADTIVAQPTTLTGSIGVFGILFSTGQLEKNKLGITTDSVQTHQLATIGNPSLHFSNIEKMKIQNSVDRIYVAFLQRVANGRGLDTAYVDSIAQGRVWTGEDALANGLVDMLGTLDTAIKIAKNMAGLDSSDQYEIQVYPDIEDPFEQLIEQFTTAQSYKMMPDKMKSIYMDVQDAINLSKLEGVQARLPVLPNFY